jgi:hypothetical protein
MPFIRGRYHINPILGEALEAAREAEATRRGEPTLEHGAGNSNDQADGFASPYPNDHAASGPIHRVEIEAAEMVPSHSGRAERGFVARVQRHAASGAPHGAGDSFAARGMSHGSAPARPETHVFSDHRDLLSFLHDELAKDQQR